MQILVPTGILESIPCEYPDRAGPGVLCMYPEELGGRNLLLIVRMVYLLPFFGNERAPVFLGTTTLLAKRIVFARLLCR